MNQTKLIREVKARTFMYLVYKIDENEYSAFLTFKTGRQVELTGTSENQVIMAATQYAAQHSTQEDENAAIQGTFI